MLTTARDTAEAAQKRDPCSSMTRVCKAGKMRAYGLSIPQIHCSADAPVSGRHVWHEMAIIQSRRAAPEATSTEVGQDAAVIDVKGVATISMTRQPLECLVAAPQSFDDVALAHPLLAVSGAVAARWMRRSAFHGAAVVVEERAWILLGESGSGKSTLSAQLHLAGFEVLADDLSVVAGPDVLAGPRSADLRADAAQHLEHGEPVVELLGRSRFRLELGLARMEAPLAGFMELQWGDAMSVHPTPLRERLATLVRHEALGLDPVGHRGLLDLLQFPMWTLVRPPDWSSTSGVDATVHIARSSR